MMEWKKLLPRCFSLFLASSSTLRRSQSSSSSDDGASLLSARFFSKQGRILYLSTFYIYIYIYSYISYNIKKIFLGRLLIGHSVSSTFEPFIEEFFLVPALSLSPTSLSSFARSLQTHAIHCFASLDNLNERKAEKNYATGN